MKNNFFFGDKNNKVPFPRNILSLLGYGMISAVVGLILTVLINISGLMELFPAYSEKYASVMHRYDILVAVLLFIVAAPVLEELFFRLFLFNIISKKTGAPVAALISSVLFGIYHMNVIQFIYALLMGLLFCFFYHRDHRFSVPVTMHMFANAAAYALSMLPFDI